MTTDTSHKRTGNRHPLITSSLETSYRNAKAAEIMQRALERIAKAGEGLDKSLLDYEAAIGMILLAKSALKRAEKMRKGEIQ